MKKIGKKKKKLQDYLKKIFGQSYMEFDACHGDIEIMNKIFEDNEETATSYGVVASLVRPRANLPSQRFN